MGGFIPCPVGQTFGHWTVLGEDACSEKCNRQWRVQCVCGRELLRTAASIRNGYSTSCGCRGKKLPSTFGRWRVIDPNTARTESGALLSLCRCSCGTLRFVASSELRSGSSQSCGCLAAELTGNRSRKHGRSDHHEYQLWRGMIGRCTNPKMDSYKYYGARGIVVCDRWLSSFDDFLADVGPRPSPAYSIDRIDNNKGYEPGNVRWAEDAEQSRNRRNVTQLSYCGETMTLEEWCRKLGRSSSYVRKMRALGVSPEQTLFGENCHT